METGNTMVVKNSVSPLFFNVFFNAILNRIQRIPSVKVQELSESLVDVRVKQHMPLTGAHPGITKGWGAFFKGAQIYTTMGVLSEHIGIF